MHKIKIHTKLSFAKFYLAIKFHFFCKSAHVWVSILTFFMFWMIMAHPISAQILPFSVKIKTQAGVQQLIAQYAPFTGIEGDLVIGNDNNITPSFSNITDLSPLACIKTIGGDLNIVRNPHLKSLWGLHNVDSIDFIANYLGLYISQNDSLVNLEGLNHLSYLDGYVHIDSCKNFTSLKGLDNLTRTEGFTISKCHRLKKITDLDNLKYIREEYYGNNQAFYEGGQISFYQNDSLEDISGLQHIRCWAGSNIYVNENKVLKEIPPIDIDSIAVLDIYDNQALKKINIPKPHFCRLVYVNDNPKLDSLLLPSVKKVGEFYFNQPGGPMEIINNHDLKWIDLQKLDTASENLKFELNPNLHTLGLKNLEYVGKDFSIQNDNYFTDKSVLKSLDGLEKLKKVRRYFEIKYMDSLKYLNNFDSLTYVGTILSIGGNNQLESVGGITNLDSMGKYGYVGLGINPIVGSLNFNDLQTDVSVNIGATNLDSFNFPKIKNINYSLYVGYNPNLQKFDFPVLYDKNNLIKQGVRATIEMNNELQTLDGIRGWSYVEDSIVIKNNPLLIDCDAICQMLENGMPASKIRIYNNVFPCNSLTEIKNNVCQFYVPTNESISADKRGISFYPNPAAEYIIIESPADKLPATLQIYSNQGQLLMSKKLYQMSAKIDVQELETGFYWLFIPEIRAWGKLIIAPN